MAETDVSHEFRGELKGFWFSFSYPTFSNVTHGGSTEMSAEGSFIERQLNCLNLNYQIVLLN